MAAGTLTTVEVDGACATLRLREPALRPEVVTELLAGLRAAEAAPGCRALVLCADGPVFCSGFDLSCVDGPDRWPAAASAAFWELLRGLAESRLVTIALVTGRATGGGVGLAAACDFVIAGPHATFRLTELVVGLTPALIMPVLAARLGAGRVVRLAVLAEELDAAAAHAAGLVDALGEDAVRRVLLALRRLPRDNVAELKHCRRLLEPAPDGYAEHAHRLLRAALADPAVRGRIGELRTAGVIA